MSEASDQEALPPDLVAAALRRRASGAAFDRIDPARMDLLAVNMRRA